MQRLLHEFYFLVAFLSGVTGETLSGSIPELLFFVFQMTFAIITPGLFVGAFAERMKFSGFTSRWARGGLSAAERAEYTAAFRRIDADGPGVVDEAELPAAIEEFLLGGASARSLSLFAAIAGNE